MVFSVVFFLEQLFLLPPSENGMLPPSEGGARPAAALEKEEESNKWSKCLDNPSANKNIFCFSHISLSFYHLIYIIEYF